MRNVQKIIDTRGGLEALKRKSIRLEVGSTMARRGCAARLDRAASRTAAGQAVTGSRTTSPYFPGSPGGRHKQRQAQQGRPKQQTFLHENTP
jgi:hypothetical protein